MLVRVDRNDILFKNTVNIMLREGVRYTFDVDGTKRLYTNRNKLEWLNCLASGTKHSENINKTNVVKSR